MLTAQYIQSPEHLSSRSLVATELTEERDALYPACISFLMPLLVTGLIISWYQIDGVDGAC